MQFGSINGLDKKISKLILGNDKQKKYNSAVKLWDCFYENGGNVFDNSIYYRNGESEKFLGKWIKSRDIEKNIVIISKVGEESSHPSEISSLLQISLERLNLNTVDILILHHHNKQVPISEYVDALNEIKFSGKIKIFGISNINKERFDDSLKWSKKHNKIPFSIINNQFSLAKMEKPLWPDCLSISDKNYINYLENNNISHFGWSSQARGFFIKKNFIKNFFRRRFHKYLKQCFYSRDNIEKRKRANELAKKYNCSPNDIALSWVINQKFPSYAIIGSKNINQLNFSINSINIKLTEEEKTWLNLT
tara:strand:- start:172 stop:1092 length:921 start_codon:yes stop_codon:yes gene_type:complete